MEQARKGHLLFFQSQLPENELQRLLKGKDEDGRGLLHAASASGSLELCQLLIAALGPDAGAAVNLQDDEVMADLRVPGAAVDRGQRSPTAVLGRARVCRAGAPCTWPAAAGMRPSCCCC